MEPPSKGLVHKMPLSPCYSNFLGRCPAVQMASRVNKKSLFSISVSARLALGICRAGDGSSVYSLALLSAPEMCPCVNSRASSRRTCGWGSGHLAPGAWENRSLPPSPFTSPVPSLTALQQPPSSQMQGDTQLIPFL